MTNEDIYPKGITQTEAEKCRSKLCYTGEKLLERTKEMVNLMKRLKRLERMAKREQVKNLHQLGVIETLSPRDPIQASVCSDDDKFCKYRTCRKWILVDMMENYSLAP
ncbi:unnamed protein product [Boreogadus saida]